MQKYEKPQLLKGSAIDLLKWDNCIINSANGNVYAQSWFLSTINPNWEALVYLDYKIVMPLTNNQKYGIYSLIQPFPAHQLGIFSQQNMSSEIIKLFIDSIPKKYKYIDINLNKYNSIDKLSNAKIANKTACAIDLIENYEQISSKYSPENKQILSKVQSAGFTISYGVTPNAFVKLLGVNKKPKNFSNYSASILRKLIANGIRYKSAFLYGVDDKFGNLKVVGLFFRSKHTVNLTLLPKTDTEDAQDAIYFLIDTFIKRFAYKNLTLEIDGSNIDDIEKFCERFCAKKYTYHNIKINRLPFLLRMFYNHFF